MKRYWPFAIILAGIVIRFFRFSELISFSYEQALALEASGKMVQAGKFSLLGVEYFIRQTSAGHSFFNSAYYLYPLAAIQWLLGFDPLFPTVFFTILNLVAGIGLYYLVRRVFPASVAMATLILFMFSPTMIDISRSIWHVNLLVPVAVISLWFLHLMSSTFKPIWLTCLGFALGLGVGFNISFAVGTLLLFSSCVLLLFKKHKPGYLIYLFFGLVLGSLPTIIFELRHNFYNTRTLVTFLRELFTSHSSGFSLEPYHLLYFLVPLFVLVSAVLIRHFPRLVGYSLLVIYVAVSIPSWRLTTKYPKGMPVGTNLQTLRSLSSIIAQDAPAEYEIASILDGETRAENLRYFLTYVDAKPPMSSDKYPEAKTLYVVSYFDQDPLTKSVWELDSVKPVKVAREWKINDLIKLTKLEKI